MYIRVLSIRKHKTITFINAYSNEYGSIQYMLENNMVENIKCGDLLNVKCVDALNNKGILIKKIVNINERVVCNNFESAKGINGESISLKDKNHIDVINGGYPIQILKYKRELIYKIKHLLNTLNYFDATGLTNTVEQYANGSNIKDAIIDDRVDSEPKYLRVTLENQLKQITSLTLQSVYAIDKVFRNMGEDSSHINEFLMLEIVSLSQDIDEITKFVKEIDFLAKELADKYKIFVPDKKMEIIDYNDVIKLNIDYETYRKRFTNTLVVNFPCNSPFIKCDNDGNRKEIRWYINGHWISHYYFDENQYSNIKGVLNEQIKNNEKKDINPLTYFEWGVPSTISMGLSIDRWLQMLLDMENIYLIANPIGLDYKSKVLRRDDI